MVGDSDVIKKAEIAWKVLPFVDLDWGSYEFRMAPDVTLLAHPYRYNYSKFTYLDHLQVNTKIGCFIFKCKNSSGETLGPGNPTFDIDIPGVRFVDPMYMCPYCYGGNPVNGYGGRHSQCSAFEGIWELSPAFKGSFQFGNAQIFIGAFDPENIPEAMRKALNARTYQQPCKVGPCGRRPECPGFSNRLRTSISKPPSRGVRNFFKMADAASKINKHANYSNK